MLYDIFTNETRKPLEAATEELKKKNFQFVEIYQSDDKVYWLHIERKEKHNSLYDLNKELYDLACRYDLQSYDGYDVGTLIRPKRLKQTAFTTVNIHHFIPLIIKLL